MFSGVCLGAPLNDELASADITLRKYYSTRKYDFIRTTT
jgi:hypothetical protein